jgi:hypothetical protein
MDPIHPIMRSGASVELHASRALWRLIWGVPVVTRPHAMPHFAHFTLLAVFDVF